MNDANAHKIYHTEFIVPYKLIQFPNPYNLPQLYLFAVLLFQTHLIHFRLI